MGILAAKLAVKDINLLPYIKARSSLSARDKKARMALIALGGVLLVLIVLFIIYSLQMGTMRARMTQLEQELYSAGAVQVFSDAQKELDALILDNTHATAVKNALEQDEGTTAYSLADFESIYAIAGERITIEQLVYSAQSKTVTIAAGSDDARAISTFVEELRASGLFGNIAYTGYEGGGGAMYSFSLACAFREVDKHV